MSLGLSFSKYACYYKRCISSRLVFKRVSWYSTSQTKRPSSDSNGEASDAAESEIYDVIVSGGGLVGSAMASAIGSSEILSQKRVLLLEGGPPINPKATLQEKYSNRVTALSPGSVNFLKNIDCWERICQMRMKPVKRMQVWESCSMSAISFNRPALEEEIAFIVENHVILKSVAEKLALLKNRVDVLYGVKAIHYDLPTDNSKLVSLKLQDGKKLKTKLLIGADGYNSLVRKTMKVLYISWNYKQQAIVATLNFAEPIENIVAWQKFLPTGPIAILPLTDTSSSLVWTVTPSMAQNLMSMSEDSFTDALNSSLWIEKDAHPIVKNVSSSVDKLLNTLFPNSGSVLQLPPSILSVDEGSRATFPLGLGHATKYVGHQVALIGDAAHRVHPLAGLGVNLGFGDVKSLVRKLEESVNNGNEIGHPHALTTYETERQRHNVPVMMGIDGLNRLYSNEFVPAMLLRSVGLQLTNISSPLKKQLMDIASR